LQLAREVLGDGLDEATVQRVADLAAGNAFFLEELIRVAAAGDALPDTVLAMIDARLHRLDEWERRLLRAGSVFGKVFWRDGVATLLGKATGDRELETQLASLVDHEMLSRRSGSRFQGQEEYAFRHAIVREAVYGALTPDDCVRGHRLAGLWLDEHGESNALALAEHFEWGEVPERAASCYLRATELALSGNDFDAVLAHSARAIGCGAQGASLGSCISVRRPSTATAATWRRPNACRPRRSACSPPANPRGIARWRSSRPRA
jgi:predicted ATPase